MFVVEILKTKGNAVFSIAPERTGADACAALEERGVGALVVCDGDRVAGVFSDRDVVRALAADGAAALNRPVADYMTAKVIFAEPKEEMSALMSRMTDRRIRHLPVLEADRLIGVITDRDIAIRAVASGAAPTDRVVEYLSREALVVREDEDIKLGLDLMRARQIRRLAVIDREGRLVGVISLGDLSNRVKERYAGEALEDISRPN